MKDAQLHEIAMLALTKTEFDTKNDPVALAEELFRNYNTVIDALKILNTDIDEEEEIPVFGMPQPTTISAKNHR